MGTPIPGNGGQCTPGGPPERLQSGGRLPLRNEGWYGSEEGVVSRHRLGLPVKMEGWSDGEMQGN